VTDKKTVKIKRVGRGANIPGVLRVGPGEVVEVSEALAKQLLASAEGWVKATDKNGSSPKGGK